MTDSDGPVLELGGCWKWNFSFWYKLWLSFNVTKVTKHIEMIKLFVFLLPLWTEKCVCGSTTNTASISCTSPRNVITIASALYGRRVHGTVFCTYKNNPQHGANNKIDCDTSVASDTAIVQSLCNNRTSCDVLPHSSVFGDPCVGTYKYLRITYTCNLNNPMSYMAGTFYLQGR